MRRMRERKDLLRRNEVKKGKILGLLLAALLAAASVPAAVFASPSEITIPSVTSAKYGNTWLTALKSDLTGLTAATSIQDLVNKTSVSNDAYSTVEKVLTYVFYEEYNLTGWAAFKNTAECSIYGNILQTSAIARIDIFLSPISAVSRNFTEVAEFIAYVAQYRPTRVILRNTFADPVVTTLALESASQFSQVSFVVESGAILSYNAASFTGSVAVESGGTLDLGYKNPKDLTFLESKLIASLDLQPGSTINFPYGTTAAQASLYLSKNNPLATGFIILVDWKKINEKPDGIAVTPLYGVYADPRGAAGANKYFAFKGTAVYFQVKLTGISDWSQFKGLYPYLSGNTSPNTKFVYQDLPWRKLENASLANGSSFDWAADLPSWAYKGADGAFYYYVPLLIGSDEAGQDVKVAFTSVAYDNFWGSEYEGVFHFAAKDMPKVTKVLIKPEEAAAAKGATLDFYTQVYLENYEELFDVAFRRDTSWSVSNKASASTKISQDGVLAVGADETAATLVVTAKTKIYGLYDSTNAIFDAPTYVVNGYKYFLPTNPEVEVTAIVRVGGNTVPPVPATLKIGASHASPTSISLNWNAAAGATGYNLYQANSSAGSYQLIASNTQSLSAVAAGLYTGSYYWFKAAAVGAKGEIAVSDPIQVRARPLRPASINAAAGSKTGSVKVSWGSVAECDGYAVYVSTSRTGTYTLKSVVSGRNSLSAQVAGLKSGATYYFKVASYVQVGPAKVPSVYTGVVSAKAK
jgi:hypothetical protein